MVHRPELIVKAKSKGKQLVYISLYMEELVSCRYVVCLPSWNVSWKQGQYWSSLLSCCSLIRGSLVSGLWYSQVCAGSCSFSLPHFSSRCNSFLAIIAFVDAQHLNPSLICSSHLFCSAFSWQACCDLTWPYHVIALRTSNPYLRIVSGTLSY